MPGGGVAYYVGSCCSTPVRRLLKGCGAFSAGPNGVAGAEGAYPMCPAAPQSQHLQAAAPRRTAPSITTPPDRKSPFVLVGRCRRCGCMWEVWPVCSVRIVGRSQASRAVPAVLGPGCRWLKGVGRSCAALVGPLARGWTAVTGVYGGPTGGTGVQRGDRGPTGRRTGHTLPPDRSRALGPSKAPRGHSRCSYLDRLRALGPLACAWTAVTGVYGGPTGAQGSNGGTGVQLAGVPATHRLPSAHATGPSNFDFFELLLRLPHGCHSCADADDPAARGP